MPKRPLDHLARSASTRTSTSLKSAQHAAPTPFATPSPDQPTALLNGLTPAQFMRRHWQKKPLLIRQAFAGLEAPLSRDALFALADNDDVESRLITHFRNRWDMQHGPFAPDDLPPVKRREWTLLVQGVDLHDDRARRLLDCFRFVPDARLDDLMISYATDGGGVGPHFDSYDVFLLQVHGKRRWRIGRQRDLSLRPDLPLKVLQHFEAEEEWVLEPGDMLYLPPHIAHDGVAEGECMTCSIGFRAPSEGELVGQFLYHMAERGEMRARADALYRDPAQAAVDEPGRLPEAMVAKLGAILAGVKWTERDIASFLGSYLSEPKSNVVFDPPSRPLDEARFVKRASDLGLRLDRRSALLYDSRSFYLNGEECKPSGSRKWLSELANLRAFSGKRFVTLSGDSSVTALLHEWYCAGWIQVGQFE